MEKVLRGEFSGMDPISKGNVTIKNCLVKNYTDHWMLADLTTDSNNNPPVALGTVLIEKNKWENVSGSFAIRGKLDEPTEKVTITGNVTTILNAHSLFWDVWEMCGGVKSISITDNTASINTQGVKNGFVQAWSKNSIPWKIYYKNNVISGFMVGLKIAMSQNTFYSPDTEDENFLIDIQNTDVVGVSVWGKLPLQKCC